MPTFFFNDTAPTEIYTLSLHDALPILVATVSVATTTRAFGASLPYSSASRGWQDRKSTRLNSSHGYISYAVFCLKKKKRLQVTILRRRIQQIWRPASSTEEPSHLPPQP